MALAKGKKRLLSYVAILGGLAVLSLTFFTISKFEKAKCEASQNTRDLCETNINDLMRQYKRDTGSTNVELETLLADTESDLNAAAVYWNANYIAFDKIVNRNAAARQATAIPAYLFSMSTLVAFGLILKHAEKAKEKEDEEAVKR